MSPNQPTPPPVPEPTQLPFSFMAMVQKTAKLPKTSRSRTIDPLTAARNAIIEAIGKQERFVQDLTEGKELPQAPAGGKKVSAWFRKLTDGWWTSIRYGQVSMPLGPNGETDLLIGDLKSMLGFYEAVKIAIGKGELDAPIGQLQAEKSAALSGAKKTA